MKELKFEIQLLKDKIRSKKINFGVPFLLFTKVNKEKQNSGLFCFSIFTKFSTLMWIN